MKAYAFLISLASAATISFAQTPTPPAPPEGEPGTPKAGEQITESGSKAHKSAVLVAVMLTLYAEDNGGKLPAKLADLVPAYAADKEMLRDLEFKTPSVEMDKLPPETVVLTHSRDPKVQIKASQLQGSKRVETKN